MLLRHLEYLTALAAERHFARAAAACHVSQPSLSAGIRRLEAELKVAIVVRDRRFVSFTPEGDVVVAWARRLLADRDAMVAEVSAVTGGLTGTLRIGAIPTAVTAVSLLTDPFCARHPGVTVRLVSASATEIVRGLADFDLDVGVTYTTPAPPAGLAVLPLWTERYLLLTADDAPLAARDRLAWADLTGLPLALLTPQMRNRQILEAAFAAAGVTPTIGVEADTVSAIYAHVATRRWSGVVSHAWLHQFGVPPGLRVVPLDPAAPLAPAGQVALLHRDRRPGPVLAGALVAVAGTLDLEAHLAGLLAAALAGAR